MIRTSLAVPTPAPAGRPARVAGRQFTAGAAYRAGMAIDRLLGIVAPRWAASRMQARATMSQISSFSNGIGGYDAGQLDRYTKGRLTNRINENAVPLLQVQRVRWQANDLYRNNPHARKMLRTLEAKVLGKSGLEPQPAATKPNGKPHDKFRQRAKLLWRESANSLDYRGRPSRGGQHFAEMQKIMLRSIVLSGDLLWHPKPLTKKQQLARQSPVPLALQLIHTERLAEYLTFASADQAPNNRLFRGIEIDNEGLPVAYWILRHHPNDPMLFATVQQADRYLASEIGHVYVSDDVDQFRGVSWFAPLLLTMRDTADYSYAELKAAALASCVTLWYNPPTAGSSLGLGVQMPENWELNDADGNPISAMQPGMMLNMGHDGKISVDRPGGPNANAERWIGYMLRSIAAGMPGVKSSTITGDYRNSSFSSERSADNDAWPELEGLQTWFAFSACQPIYEDLIRAGVLAGWFDGIVSAAEFNERPRDFLRSSWQGPVQRSINPVQDATSARMRVQNMQSSPQLEAAALGRDWHEVLGQISEFVKTCERLEIPPRLVDLFLGITETEKTTDQETVGANGEDLSAAPTKQKPGSEDDDSQNPPAKRPAKPKLASAA